MRDYQVNAAALSAQEAASEARSTVRDLEAQVNYLKSDVDRLMMITEGLWTLLKRANNFTDQELRDLVNEIDLRDGKLDGRCKPAGIYVCPACSRPVSIRMNTCMYCGQLLQHDLFAR